METLEHVYLGNCLKIALHDNPFLDSSAKGPIKINLQRLGDNGLPRSVSQWLTPGEIIAMVDYYTQKGWDMQLDLPSCREYDDIQELGRYLIENAVDHEEKALYNAYQNLASDDVSEKDIQRILSIVSTRYIPFSKSLNKYAQLLLLSLTVKNYGDLLNFNQTHFTPWAVRCYVLGHHQALQFARFAWFLNQLAENSDCQPPDNFCAGLYECLRQAEFDFNPDKVKQMVARFHALSLAMELFTLHYYTDHFAAGHMSQVGDLRTELQRRFGRLGGILANNIHNGLNKDGTFTWAPYDSEPNRDGPPVFAKGDGFFGSCLNAHNAEACIDGMQASLEDIEQVLATGAHISQTEYGGLSKLADADYQFRQHQPLFAMHADKIYQRKNLKEVHLLSPTDYENTLADPLAHGYKELKSKWQAFKLVVKLRLLPFIYKGKVQPVSEEYLQQIKDDEAQRNPDRDPIPDPPCPESRDKTTGLDWRTVRENCQPSAASQGFFAPATPPHSPLTESPQSDRRDESSATFDAGLKPC